MNPFYSIVLVISMTTASSVATAQTTYVDNGTSTTYTLGNGDSLYIKKGTFTGTVNDQNKGGKVTVAAGASFKPSSVNGFRSEYTIYGTAVLASLNTEKGFGLNNYGTLTVNGGSQVNANNQVWINQPGGIINVNGSFAINSNNTDFTNSGDVNISMDFNVWGNATIINKKNMVIGGSFNSSKGAITNQGLFSTGQTLTISGNTSFTNTCRTITQNGFSVNNSNATVYNSGLIWAAGSTNSYLTNSGTIINTGDAIIKTGAFTNYKTVRGNGSLYILGKSTLGGGATAGTSGSTTDKLKIYTVNRTNTAQVFDDQWGTVYPSAYYTTMAAPDTITASSYPCSQEYAPFIILPVTYDNFSANLASDIPVLNWSVKFDDGTVFDIERSENGTDFVKVGTVAGTLNVNDYTYRDLNLSANHAAVVYYRIKAVEPKGTYKYSEVKTVRFTVNAATAVQAWPNPFNSQLTLTYKATQKGNLTISIFNQDGKLQLIKTTVVNSGNNSIIVSEAARLAKGIYIIRISNAGAEVSSTKIIKQ